MTVNWYKDNPAIVFEFEVVGEIGGVKSMKPMDSGLIGRDKIHLEIIGDERISLIAANEVVEWFEHQLPDAEIEWNITQSTVIKPGMIMVCCVRL
ncbi:hypothetical protein QTL97_04420 [Sporosarcina thermotolerans]|uniref:Uncharacterized protein n=1 Tax=Sporosarcina thermotolerans TaxID=633404 RepID=A0AAW9A940_9BACL|nr:hypothetical protein [Sporosarcina thermotolerans]MDW0116166.1 hypothetical protein [Sporosarcina thermotolerans]WHT48141.1 hypothetical protein QNH10_19285 [Sporosarcina thermotolerans]